MRLAKSAKAKQTLLITILNVNSLKPEDFTVLNIRYKDIRAKHALSASDRIRKRNCMFDQEIIQSAEQALGISGEQMKVFQEQSEFLASKRAKQDQIDNYLADIKICDPALILTGFL